MTKVIITDYWLEPPLTGITPVTAMQDFNTYSKRLIVNMEQTRYTFRLSTNNQGGRQLDIQPKRATMPKVHLGNIPIMYGTSYCDGTVAGRVGDFTIQGRIKHMQLHHTSGEDMILLVNQSRACHAVVHSRSTDNPTMLSACYLMSSNDCLCIRSPTIFKTLDRNRAVASSRMMPLALLLRAFGITTDKEIFDAIVGPHANNQDFCIELQNMLQRSGPIQKKDEETWLNCVVRYIRRGNAFNHAYSNLQNSYRDWSKSELYLKTVIDTESDIRLIQACMRYYPDYHKMKFQRACYRLQHEFLPHLNRKNETFEEALKTKAWFICRMTREYIEARTGMRSWTDRDSYKNKRFMTHDEILTCTLYRGMKNMLNEARKQFRAEVAKCRKRKTVQTGMVMLSDMIDSSKITNTILYGFRTGEFYVSNNRSIKGVMLDISSTCCMTDIVSSMTRIRPVAYELQGHTSNDARLLHPSTNFFVCCIETPEGNKTGMNENLAISTEITVFDCNSIQRINQWLNENSAKYGIHVNLNHGVGIVVNGRQYGMVHRYIELYQTLLRMKRLGLWYTPAKTTIANVDTTVLHRQDSVVLDLQEREIRINTQGGRMTRPVWTVHNNRTILNLPKMYCLLNKAESWDDFVHLAGEGLEYIDMEQALYQRISLNDADLKRQRDAAKENKRFSWCTHREIDPSFMIGYSASNAPFPNHNAAARNIFYTSMAKKAVSTSRSFQTNMKTRKMFQQHHQHRPIVRPAIMKNIGSESAPGGQNLVVGIMAFTGYNQEDAVIMNRQSLQSGTLRCSCFSTEHVLIQTIDNMREYIKIPDDTVKNTQSKQRYAKLAPNGVVRVGTKVEENDIIIGRITPRRLNSKQQEASADQNNVEYVDTSIQVPRGINGTVDRILMTKTTCYNNARCIVRIRNQRDMTLGDKVASRQGQKGVVGLILPARDMPYTIDGVVPDLLINPHAMPSRMTISYLIEGIVGRAAIEQGILADATIFQDPGIKSAQTQLKRAGIDPWCLTTMTNGQTGERLHCRICVAPVYYHSLAHKVKDKHFCASKTVKLNPYFRQPAEGRARGGGLRIGEMERDSLIAHGTTDFIRERLMEVSDQVWANVCRTSHQFCHALYRKERFHGYQCRECANKRVTCVATQLPAKLTKDQNGQMTVFRCAVCRPACREVRREGKCTDVSQLKIPYPLKLLQQHMEMINIRMDIHTTRV